MSRIRMLFQTASTQAQRERKSTAIYNEAPLPRGEGQAENVSVQWLSEPETRARATGSGEPFLLLISDHFTPRRAHLPSSRG